MAKSPLVWFGGKAKYAELIISKFPDHRKYVEPFGGGAHVIAQKPRKSHEVYNDIDGNVVNFILIARSDPDRLYESCESMPYSRELYEQWKREPLPSDPFERAVRFYYMNRSGIQAGNAKEVSQTGWSHCFKSGKTSAGNYISACNRISAFAERMKGVMIENDDFRNIIRKYDSPETLFYVDPPYVGREAQYAGGFTEQDHRDLAAALSGAQGKAVLSYYSDPLIDELYKGWHVEKFEAHKQVVGSDTPVIQTEELLIMNFDNGQLTLF